MAQSLSRVLVHFIFSTNDRFAFLVDGELGKRMHGYLAKGFNEHDSPAIEEHHRRRTLQEEYLEFLRENQIPYDDRYLWT